MEKAINQKLQKHKMVTRVLFMIFFIIVYGVSKFLIIGLALFQLITILMTEKPNEQVLGFTHGLSVYIMQIVQLLTFNSELKPFPFSPWPDVKNVSDKAQAEEDSE